MLASAGDGRADESSDLLLAVCPTLLAIPLPDDCKRARVFTLPLTLT
jgi:hypothetical protein